MENQDVPESSSPSSKTKKVEEPVASTSIREEKPVSNVVRIEIWNRIKYGHVTTAMRLRSLLLFVSATLTSFIETISEPKTVKIPPTEIITRIVTNFIKGSVEQQRSFSHETFLDILLEKIPNSDVKGMHFHEVYLAISPMIASVNWPRIKFDRRDAMRCYTSLANILHVCFEQVGLANHAEADQLVLAIYVTSVWCSILKQHPELAQPIYDHQDFEAYMKTWVFHTHFENFAKVFVASCCQIMESSDQIDNRIPKLEKKSPQVLDTPSTSLTSSLPEAHKLPDQNSSPALPPISQIHPSWRMTYHFDPYMGYMHPGPVPFVPYPPAGIHPPLDPHHQNYPPALALPQINSTSPAVSSAPSTPRVPKRKQKKLPDFQELADTVTWKRNKKGPKPGTKYRKRITGEASKILEIEARRVAMNPPDRHSKRKISERTNISLYQVKSFFNRITAEERRRRLGKPLKRSRSGRKPKASNS